MERKRDIFSQYKTAVENIAGLTMTGVPDYADNNHWMNMLQIDSESYGENMESLMQRLEKNSIQARPVWGLNHLQKPYMNCQNYRIKRAEELVSNSLSLPSSTNISKEDLDNIIEILTNNVA